jgi:hypothetical protein
LGIGGNERAHHGSQYDDNATSVCPQKSHPDSPCFCP